MLESCIGYCGKLPKGFSYNPSLDFKKTFHFLKGNVVPISVFGTAITVLGLAIGSLWFAYSSYSSLKKEGAIINMDLHFSSICIRKDLNAINNPTFDITRDLSFQDLQELTGLNKSELLRKLDEYSELRNISFRAEQIGDRNAYNKYMKKIDNLLIPLVEKNSIIF